MLPISVCIIAKNEEKNITDCLRRLRPHFREIIVVDTGSKDQTLELARQYADRVLTYHWTNDFAAARNFSIQQSSYPWILVIDCDEFLEEIDASEISQLMKAHPSSLGQLTRDSMCYTASGSQTILTDKVERLFRKDSYHFEGIIHEQPVPSKGQPASAYSIPLRVLHTGYSGSKESLVQKADRDIALLEIMLLTSPDDPYLYYQLGQAYSLKSDYDNAFHYFDQGLYYDVDPSLDYVKMMIVSYGYSMLETDRSKDALQLMNLYDTFQDYGDYLFMMGSVHLKEHKNKEALELFTKAMQATTYHTQGVTSYRSAFNIARIQEEALHDYDKAMQYYDLASLHPESSYYKDLLLQKLALWDSQTAISVCIIVKDDAANLERCLKTLREYPLEIIVLDTGSSDETILVAQKYAHRIEHFSWCDDFSAARNFSLALAKYDQILVLDSDEFPRAIPIRTMRALANQFPYSVGCLQRESPTYDGGLCTDYVERYFDRRYYHYTRPIHEQLTPLTQQPYTTYHLGLIVDHAGYQTKTLLAQKTARNLRILTQSDATNEDPYSLFQIGQSLYTSLQFEEALLYFHNSLKKQYDPSMQYTSMMLFSMGYCYLELKKPQDGLELLGMYEEDLKQWSDYHFLLGSFHYNQKQWSLAMLSFMKATMAPHTFMKNTKNKLPNTYLGNICELLGDSTTAQTYYDKAASIDNTTTIDNATTSDNK